MTPEGIAMASRSDGSCCETIMDRYRVAFPVMGVLTWLRNAISGPPHIEYGSGDEGAEAEAALSDGMPGAAEDEASLERSEAPESSRRRYPQPGTAAFEEAETAQENAESEEPPPETRT
jgi:hypothetical protein